MPLERNTIFGEFFVVLDSLMRAKVKWLMASEGLSVDGVNERMLWRIR